MRRPYCVLLIGCAAFLAQIEQLSAADWEMKTVSDGKKNSCLIVSAAKPIFDGYQEVMAQIIVDNKSVTIKSDSVLDMGSSDIGLKVGRRDLVAADKVIKDKQAIFDSKYDEIVKLFKAGREVTLQARFWPTWPATGAHSASFSLMGFTKAYEDAMRCEQ